MIIRGKKNSIWFHLLHARCCRRHHHHHHHHHHHNHHHRPQTTCTSGDFFNFEPLYAKLSNCHSSPLVSDCILSVHYVPRATGCAEWLVNMIVFSWSVSAHAQLSLVWLLYIHRPSPTSSPVHYEIKKRFRTSTFTSSSGRCCPWTCSYWYGSYFLLKMSDTSSENRTRVSC